MDLKLHVYSVPLLPPLRPPASLGILRWGDASDQKLEAELELEGTAFPRVLLHFNHCYRSNTGITPSV